MTSYENESLAVTRYSLQQHLTYVMLAFAIWLTGVVIVRVLPDSAFDMDESWPILLYAASIGLGIGTQLAAPLMTRLPAPQTLIPIMVICGIALMLDGLAIGFTDIYSSDVETKVVVGGWLLWTFGTQLVISILMVGRAQRS